MSSAVVVTGIGIISSIGNNLKETTHALLNMQSGIKPISILNTRHKDDFVLGEVKKTQEELHQLANADADKPWTRTAFLG